MMGPESLTFNKLTRDSPDGEHAQNNEEWQYFSLVADNRTFDFWITNRKDLLDFLVGMGSQIKKTNKHFF